MKKIFSLLILAVFLLPTICLAAEKPTVAVIPFIDQSPKNDVVFEGNMDTIRDDIEEAMNRTKKFTMVPRVHVDKILAEMKLNNTDLFDPETASKFGKWSGAKYLILGTINGFKSNKKGNYTAYLSVRMIEVETAEIFLSGRGEGKSDENMLVAMTNAADDAMNGKRGMLTMMRGGK